MEEGNKQQEVEAQQQPKHSQVIKMDMDVE